MACLCAGSLAATNARKLCPTLGVYNVGHDSSCTKYYVCFNQQVVELECASGLLYDRELNSCVQSHLTECRLDLCPAEQRFAMVANPHDCKGFVYMDSYICSCVEFLIFHAFLTPLLQAKMSNFVTILRLSSPNRCFKYYYYQQIVSCLIVLTHIHPFIKL